MAKLVAFYSRADENYFGGAYRCIPVGNTEKVANMIAEAAGTELFPGCLQGYKGDKRADHSGRFCGLRQSSC